MNLYQLTCIPNDSQTHVSRRVTYIGPDITDMVDWTLKPSSVQLRVTVFMRLCTSNKGLALPER